MSLRRTLLTGVEKDCDNVSQYLREKGLNGQEIVQQVLDSQTCVKISKSYCCNNVYLGIEQDFCIKTSKDKSQDWPRGRYCILQHEACPAGLTAG